VTPPPPPSPAAADLKALVAKVTAKMKEGKKSAADLAPEIAEFDALLAKYKNEKTDDVAQIAMTKATLYSQVIGDSETAKKLLEQIKVDFTGTKVAANVDRAITSMERGAKAKQIQTTLIGKPAPELHFKWASREGLKTLSGLKGKVVVLDFWATWCGPCISSFPQVRELTEHYKGADVQIIGVTSIQGYVANMGPRIDTKGDPAKEMGLMPEFMKAKNMTWTVAFSEEPVFNPDYGVQGIPYVAIIAPDGTVRHAGLHPTSPLKDKTAKIDPLLKEFGLKVAATR
jgi:thiol-disulfide isomerase/thioredoxin